MSVLLISNLPASSLWQVTFLLLYNVILPIMSTLLIGNLPVVSSFKLLRSHIHQSGFQIYFRDKTVFTLAQHNKHNRRVTLVLPYILYEADQSLDTMKQIPNWKNILQMRYTFNAATTIRCNNSYLWQTKIGTHYCNDRQIWLKKVQSVYTP